MPFAAKGGVLEELKEKPEKDDSAASAGLVKELEAVRKRQKILKIAAAVLSVVFAVVVFFAVFLYRKISAAKDTFEAMDQAFSGGGLVKVGADNNTGVMLSGGPSGGSLPSSIPLSMFANTAAPGSVSGGPALAAANPEKTVNALMKYKDRPIVLEVMAELKKDPAFEKALAEADPKNPLKMLATLRGVKNMDKIAAKFATRPDFMKLLMEVMTDPELKNLTRNLPAQGLPLPPAPSEEPMPVAARAQAAAEEPSGPDAEIKFDPSAINGGAGAPAAYGDSTRPAAIKRTPPPPVGD